MGELWNWHWYQDVTTQIHTEDSWKCYCVCDLLVRLRFHDGVLINCLSVELNNLAKFSPFHNKYLALEQLDQWLRLGLGLQ